MGSTKADRQWMRLSRFSNGPGRPSEWCVVVTVDVKNAFNTADWGRILYALRGKRVSSYLMNVISDYLTDRGILIDARGSVREVNVGVPQGSILGPTL